MYWGSIRPELINQPSFININHINYNPIWWFPEIGNFPRSSIDRWNVPSTKTIQLGGDTPMTSWKPPYLSTIIPYFHGWGVGPPRNPTLTLQLRRPKPQPHESRPNYFRPVDRPMDLFMKPLQKKMWYIVINQTLVNNKYKYIYIYIHISIYIYTVYWLIYSNMTWCMEDMTGYWTNQNWKIQIIKPQERPEGGSTVFLYIYIHK